MTTTNVYHGAPTEEEKRNVLLELLAAREREIAGTRGGRGLGLGGAELPALA